MSKVHYRPTSQFAVPMNIGKRWVPSLGIWGVGAGTAVLFLLSVTPLVKKGFLVNVPLVGTYYEDKTPASDKPF